jgi:acyl-CoA synthetase (AMP-forming)/AMP-acid ligase II
VSLRGGPAVLARHATLCEALDRAAESDRGVTFVDLAERETHHPWSAVASRAREVAAGLREAGVAAGDRVALLLRTGPAFLECFYGALYAGAVPVPLYPPVRLGRLDDYHAATAAMLRRVEAAMVVSETPLSRLLGPSLERARPRLGLRLHGSLHGAGSHHAAVDPDALALIQFSSGSTVDPKPVCLTHRQLQIHVATLMQIVDPTPEDLYVSWLPLYHDMGLIGALLTTVDYPGPLVLIPPEVFLAKPLLWLRALSRHHGTISGAPNFAYGLCLKRIPEPEIVGLDLSRWRLAFNGAEPISAEIARRFLARLAPAGLRPEALRPVYGLSEAALALTFPPARTELRILRVDGQRLAADGTLHEAAAESGARELVSVGPPIPGVDLSLRDARGAELPEGRVGRIFARGPSLLRGYFGDTTAGTLVDGWLDTGDLGVAFEGEAYIVGRAKDLVIVRGANHPPQEFEDCLEGLPGLRAGCAVALGFVPERPVGEDQDGEELLLLAEWSEPPEKPEALIALIRTVVLGRTALCPHTIELLAPGTLPRTSSGKLRRSEALRLYQAGALRPPREVTPLRLIGAMAQSALAYARLKLGR